MCVRSCGLKVQKGEAEVSLLLFRWQPPNDVLSYFIEKCCGIRTRIRYHSKYNHKIELKTIKRKD